jgi:hypothetical protein
MPFYDNSINDDDWRDEWDDRDYDDYECMGNPMYLWGSATPITISTHTTTDLLCVLYGKLLDIPQFTNESDTMRYRNLVHRLIISQT